MIRYDSCIESLLICCQLHWHVHVPTLFVCHLLCPTVLFIIRFLIAHSSISLLTIFFLSVNIALQFGLQFQLPFICNTRMFSSTKQCSVRWKTFTFLYAKFSQDNTIQFQQNRSGVAEEMTQTFLESFCRFTSQCSYA